MEDRIYSMHQHEIRDFQIIALRWSIVALEQLDGITRESMQESIDSDKAVMEKLEKGETYADT